MIVGGNFNLPPGATEQQTSAEYEDCEQEFYQHKFTPYTAPVLSPGPLFDWAKQERKGTK